MRRPYARCAAEPSPGVAYTWFRERRRLDTRCRFTKDCLGTEAVARKEWRMAEERKEADREVLAVAERKMELIAQVRTLQAEMAKLNVELVRRGADPNLVACW